MFCVDVSDSSLDGIERSGIPSREESRPRIAELLLNATYIIAYMDGKRARLAVLRVINVRGEDGKRMMLAYWPHSQRRSLTIAVSL